MAKQSINDSVKTFRKISEAHVEELFERFPTMGSSVGRHEFDAELERPNEKLMAAHEKSLRKMLTAVQDLPEHDFGGDDWLDRRAFLADLRTDLWRHERGTHRHNPETWASGAIESIYGLVVKNADNLKPSADAILSRLKQLPAYLESAASLLKDPVPLWQTLTLKSCEGAPSLFDAMEAPLVSTGKSPEARVKKLCSDAKAAFGAYAKTVAKLKPGNAGGFSVGRERFEALIRERMGWDLSVEEAESMGRHLAERLQAEMKHEAKKFSPTKSAREILDDAAQAWTPSKGSLIEEYTHLTFHVRDTVKAKNLVTFPKGEKLLVKPVPEFLRHHFPTAAYSAPGCYDPDQTGIFWVNDLSLIRKTQKEKDAEIAQHFGLAATCAHEAYPGHHLQFCTANQHPSKLRRLFAHAIFYEGWTLWCEKMMVDQGIDQNPYAKLNHLHDALWRANRILIDCGLQTGKMSYDDGVNHLVKHVGFTKGRAQGDVNWYTQQPTVPMSYLLGRTELLRLKAKKVDQQGWSLKQFNDWILSFGTIPWRWMEHV